jgi:5'-3' exonuclease
MLLVIDAMNFFHRCRVGLKGQFALHFNAFRNLRAEIARHPAATKAILVFEGKSKRQLDLDVEYKANRDIKLRSEAEQSNLLQFFADVAEIKTMFASCLPLEMLSNPDFEADDVIAALADEASKRGEASVIVSNDSDFTQIVGRRELVSVWNPRMKSFVQQPDYDYVTWKSLRGDGSDNVQAVDGCTDKLAARLASDFDAMALWLDEKSERWDRYALNRFLIEFADPASVLPGIVSSWKTQGYDTKFCEETLKQHFDLMGTNSLLSEASLARFRETYGKLSK